MRIAITGATGVLGRHLVREWTEDELVLIGRSPTRLEENFGSRADVQLEASDYSVESLAEAIDGAEAVVHLAGIRHRADFRSIFDYADNIRTVENLFDACETRRVANVVLLSSRTVYTAGFNSLPFREDQPVAPRLLYGLSKRVAECLGLVRDALNVKALRMAQLLAANEREGYMLATFLRCARRGEPLTLFGRGAGRREYLYARDAARAIRAALAKPEARGVFNLGSGANTAHRELAEAVSRAYAGGTLEIRYDPSRAEDTSELLMDSAKFRGTFGWQPAFTLDAALEDMRREEVR